MSDQCDQCGALLKDTTNRFCESCGAEVHPLDILFAPSLDEDASGFVKFVEKLKIFYFERVYDLNFNLAKRSRNLFNSRMYLYKNLSIIERMNLSERAEKLDEVQMDLKAIANKIKTETEFIQTQFSAAEDAYLQGEFLNAKIILQPLHQKTRKLGFYQWLSDITRNETQIEDNFSVLRNIQKIPKAESLSSENIESTLHYGYFKINQIENDVTSRNDNPSNALKIHPHVTEKLQELKQSYETKYTDLNKPLPEFGFGDKFKYFFKSTTENLGYFTTHFKFNRLLKQGEDYSNLPKAWESLQAAKQIIESDTKNIYDDKIAEFNQIFENTRTKIDELNEQKNQAIEKALEKMMKFDFIEALQILSSTIETLTKYKMEVPIEELKAQISFCEYNKNIETELNSIQDIYELGDYLEAQKQMALLKKNIADNASQEIVESLTDEINKFEEKITISRNEGESLLIEDVEETWHTLTESLDFSTAYKNLNEKLELAQKQNYASAIEKINIMLQNLELNQTSFEMLQKAIEIFEKAKFKASQEVLNQLDERINKSKANHFDLLIKKSKTFTNKLTKKIAEEEKSIKADIEKAEKLFTDHLEFFQATELLGECKIRAENADLTNIISVIDKSSVKIIRNQKIQTEQLSFESRIKEGKLQAAKMGLDDLLAEINENPSEYAPLLVENLQNVIKKLDSKIKAEGKLIEEKINLFHDKMDEAIDFQESIVILQDLLQRIKLNGLTQYDDALDNLTQKIATNKEKIAEYEAVQKIFEEGDIQVAEKQASQLLDSINKELKKSPRKYSVTLKEAVELLNSEIGTALKDGLDTLTSDFTEIQKKALTALDFSEILQRLKSYQIRAQRLGEEDLKNQIVVLESQVQYNANLMAKHNLLAQRYERMEDFIQTLREIKNLASSAETDAAIFDQVKSVLLALKDRVESDSSDREERMRTSLQNIIEQELNNLDFSKASESLRGLKETAQGLAIATFNSEINKFLMICQTHKNFKIRAESAFVKAKSGEIMQARETLGDIQSDIQHHDGPLLDAMKEYIDTEYQKIDTQIKNEIQTIAKDVKDRLLPLVEAKKGEMAYFILEEHLNRAKYLESDSLVDEIGDLMKLCTMQFDPTDKKYRKQKKKLDVNALDEQIEQVLERTTMKPAEPTAEMIEEQKAGFQTMMVKLDPQAQEKRPHFETVGELREYKKKQRLIKRTRVVKAPKMTENLNNEVRSSVTRTRLQAFDRQVNRPLKRTNSTSCLNCGYLQKDAHTPFCEFCGKPM